MGFASPLVSAIRAVTPVEILGYAGVGVKARLGKL
jgi:hypothetical protein